MDINSNATLNKQIECDDKTNAKKKIDKSDIAYRNIIMSIVAFIAFVCIFTAQSFAYFTDASNASNNRIVSGSLDISLIEINGNGSFNWSAEPIKIMPASVVTCGEIGVENDGTVPLYVRIKVEKTIIQSEYEMSPGWEDLIGCNFMANNETLPEEKRDLWIYHEGYYYYKLALLPGEQTTSLFDKVLFSPEMDNEFENCSIQFKLICQAVQSRENSDDPTSAWGWPEGQSVSE